MNQGNSEKQSLYYPLPSYRQVIPARSPLLRIEVYEDFLFDLLRITNVSPREIEIDAVHVDAAFPLRIAVVDTPELFRLANYPLKIKSAAGFSLLLRATSTSPILGRFCYPKNPKKIIVATSTGLLIFDYFSAASRMASSSSQRA